LDHCNKIIEHCIATGLFDLRASYHHLLRSTWRLGSGELLSRIFSVSVVVLLGHLYGVALLGVYALATSVSQYLTPVIDFGLRHVGARLMARFPRSASEIMHSVQRRRLGMAVATLPFILLYARLARLPLDMKVFVFVFAAISVMYALSLEWAAWGREQLRLIGLSKAIVPGSVLVCTLAAIGGQHMLAWLVVGNLIGYSLQGVVFWVWWRRQEREIGEQERDVAAVAESLAWQRTSVMGLALLGNLAFTTIDMLMLGAMSNPEQMGLYSAAYRVLNQVLVTYYLLTNVLYPQLARQTPPERLRMLRPRILLTLFAAGIAIATPLVVFRRPVLAIVFGHPFVAAAPLLSLLAWCIPLDFLTLYLLNAYIAWGMEKKILVCTVVAAGVEIVLNTIGIPRYGALAAAVNTLISYLVLLAGLTLVGRTLKASTRQAEPSPLAINHGSL
jgi:O-antigen/teichoic acid export membrane protein